MHIYNIAVSESYVKFFIMFFDKNFVRTPEGGLRFIFE